MNSVQGLTSREAEERVVSIGLNTLPSQKRTSYFLIFLSQFKSPLVVLLIVASTITYFWQGLHDALVIFFAAFINGVIGFFQESKAGRDIEVLQRYVVQKSKVIRDGKVVLVDVTNIVPGDVTILASGDKVPADGVLIEAISLAVDESILTGESSPVEKVVKAVSESITDESGIAYMGTTVIVGRGKLLITKTGSSTKLGKIAGMLKETKSPETPLQNKIKNLARALSVVAIVLALSVFLFSFAKGRGLADSFALAVSLAVAAIPEGLSVSITVILALGMRRILKKKALVRTLIAAETLGSVTVIATDKTGTITEGRMRVIEKKTTDLNRLILGATLCNNLGTAVDAAIWEWVMASGKDFDPEKITDLNPRLAEIPFVSEQKFMATLNSVSTGPSSPKANTVFSKGAPDLILGWCKTSLAEKDYWINQIEELSAKGFHLIGFAERVLGDDLSTDNEKLIKENIGQGFSFLGILAFSDPIRPEITQALKEIQSAGVRVMLLTGDYRKTAETLVKNIGWGLSSSEVVEGKEIEDLPEVELMVRLKTAKVFARVTPADKLRLVSALQRMGESVAMTGDGVNDAPALKMADIGIAVGSATEVAKEVSDVILLDSNFSTIVSSIEEGRVIFDNVRKVVMYLLSNSLIETSLILLSLLFGPPLPITAVQILWVNLINDIFPAVSLAFEPKERGIMREKPRKITEELLTPPMGAIILLTNLFVPLIIFLSFVYYYRQTGDIVLCRTITFALLSITVLFYIFSLRSLRHPIWKVSPFSNTPLVFGVLIGMILLLTTIYFKPVADFLAVKSLGVSEWLFIGSICAIILFGVELLKLLLIRPRHRV